MRISAELVLSPFALGVTPEIILKDCPGPESGDLRACMADAHMIIPRTLTTTCSLPGTSACQGLWVSVSCLIAMCISAFRHSVCDGSLIVAEPEKYRRERHVRPSTPPQHLRAPASSPTSTPMTLGPNQRRSRAPCPKPCSSCPRFRRHTQPWLRRPPAFSIDFVRGFYS